MCSVTSLTYLHGLFEEVGIILGRCFQQREDHILQIAFQSTLQCCIQRLCGITTNVRPRSSQSVQSGCSSPKSIYLASGLLVGFLDFLPLLVASRYQNVNDCLFIHTCMQKKCSFAVHLFE